ncbi:unnamed protein product [Dracunculus medinensis]|uniref:Uncharacterized protein n=1 Tax=Dracunculus medinensis TaxID=318479 RepID=A0A0N4UAW8_DRAME|nr:unnamed protein product [Dracunculus medinensis]
MPKYDLCHFENCFDCLCGLGQSYTVGTDLNSRAYLSAATMVMYANSFSTCVMGFGFYFLAYYKRFYWCYCLILNKLNNFKEANLSTP